MSTIDPSGYVGEDWIISTVGGKVVRVIVRSGQVYASLAEAAAVEGVTTEAVLADIYFYEQQLALQAAAAEAGTTSAGIPVAGSTGTFVVGLYAFLAIELGAVAIELGLIGWYTYEYNSNNVSGDVENAPSWTSNYGHYFYEDFLENWIGFFGWNVLGQSDVCIDARAGGS